MALDDDLKAEVRKIFKTNWDTRDGQKVPAVTDLKLGNDAVKVQATVLYADLADSTKLVDNQTPLFAAEVYKTYLLCASRLIKEEGGTITAFDGDRVMAIFIDGLKNTAAVRCALKIKYAVTAIINPLLKEQYPNSSYEVKQVVGIDTSFLHVARTGVWGTNDLVWVGRAANYAAKLSGMNEAAYYTYITKDVYDAMSSDVKVSSGKDMWESRKWTAMNNMSIYRSFWGWII